MAPSRVSPPETPTTTSLTKSQIASRPDNSNQSATNGAPDLAPLSASLLQTTLTSAPRSVPALGDPAIVASNTCTDHMITAQWDASTGWEAPKLEPYGPFSIMPTASVLHYATECFEGMKLYRGYDGRLRLFRPNRNCERMRRSAARIALPDFDGKELEKLILQLCAQDGDKWLPKDRAGSFLYIRPTMIANDPTLGVQMPRRALLYVILVVFPDMSKANALGPAPSTAPETHDTARGAADGVQGLKLLASKEDTIRAWPGGFGFAKLGSNYGPTLLSEGEARSRGFNQILWLFGEESFVTEAGASNFFIVWRTKSGELELVTAPLEQKIILEGVTRASILEIAKQKLGTQAPGVEGLKVVEKPYTMQELQDAVEEGRLIEAFAAGTAFFVAPVGLIEWKGKELRVPTKEGSTGTYARLLRGWLSDIMYGNEEHEWGVLVLGQA